MQGYIRETAQRTRAIEADLLADAGLNLATLDLTMVRDGALKSGRFVTTGAAVGCLAGDKGALFIRTQDAAGRVNINLASQNLLSALFMGSGIQPEAATRYAARIIDFRDRDDDREPAGAELKDYLAQGEASVPRMRPSTASKNCHRCSASRPMWCRLCCPMSPSIPGSQGSM